MKIGVEMYINLAHLGEELKKLGRPGFSETKKGDKFITVSSFIDPNSLNKGGKHGVISPSLTKDEKGAEVGIVGNVKVFWSEDGSHAKAERQDNSAPQPQADPRVFEDDIPW